MSLRTYLSTMDGAAQVEFAEKCKTSRGHLLNVSYGYKTAAPTLAVLVEQNSEGVVTRQQLRPNDWQAIWPELAKPRKPAAITAQPHKRNQTAKAGA